MTERRPQTESELIEHLRALDVGAPETLHERIGTLVAERSAPARRRWPLGAGERSAGAGGLTSPAWRLAAAGAMVVAAVAVALLVNAGRTGSGSAPSARAAALLALQRPTMAAPHESASNRAQLTAAVDGVAFPYWEEGLGWRSVGARSDRVAGRTVSTVFYADPRGQRIGYAIVGGTPPPALAGGVVTRRRGTVYRLLSVDGAGAVVWLRDGHLCVVAGRGVDGATLLRLASWDRGATPA
jgi:hypothetical protein